MHRMRSMGSNWIEIVQESDFLQGARLDVVRRLVLWSGAFSRATSSWRRGHWAERSTWSSKLRTELRIQQFCRLPEADKFMDWPSSMLGGGCHASLGIAARLGVLERPRQVLTREFPARCIRHAVTGRVALPPGEWYNPPTCPGQGWAAQIAPIELQPGQNETDYPEAETS